MVKITATIVATTLKKVRKPELSILTSLFKFLYSNT
jgi:hypothetical protein